MAASSVPSGTSSPQTVLRTAKYEADEALQQGNCVRAAEMYDRVLELDPALAPRLWQRGLALYYAQRFDEGKLQFEKDKEENATDIEESVWRFLCMARSEGFAAARANIMSLTPGDTRVPMKQVFKLFEGSGDIEAVYAAARNNADVLPIGVRTRRMFYAHYYVGLYQYALATSATAETDGVVGEGDGRTPSRTLLEQAHAAITQAVNDFAVPDFMMVMARVHLQLCPLEA